MLKAIFITFANFILKVFPTSPFKDVDLSGVEHFMGYMNWFFPVGACLDVISCLLVSIALYYVWSVVGRWLKVLGS